MSIRTITAEYLIAMKLRSGRKYKSDLSDIIGILNEHHKQGKPITLDAINRAVDNLYGGWEGFPTGMQQFVEDAVKNGNYEEVFGVIKNEEIDNKNNLKNFEKANPGATNTSNVNEILQYLKEQRNNKVTKEKHQPQVDQISQ